MSSTGPMGRLVTLGCNHCIATRDECERRMVNTGRACCQDCEHPVVREARQ